MPLTPKSVLPQSRCPLPIPALAQAADGGLFLFTAPPGYLAAGTLAAALRERGRPTLWLRLGPEDRDPGVLLLSAIACVQRLRADAGGSVLELMRRQPGPVAGWPPLFVALAEELARTLGGAGALVVEHCHFLSDSGQALRLLSAHVLDALPPAIACILISERPLPAAALPARTIFRGADDLRLNGRTAQALAEQSGVALPARCIRGATDIVEGRALALAGVYAAGEVLGPAPIQQALSRVAKMDDLLAWIARAWLVTSESVRQQALALALNLGYAHPAMLEHAIGATALPLGPWLEQLEGGWFHILSLWHAPLRAVLPGRAQPSHQIMQRAADYLVGQSAIEQALPLYFEYGGKKSAARVLAGVADQLMSLGQWEILDEWLSQLPVQTLEQWPWLVYTGGELAAAQGRAAAAQRAFGLATKLFTSGHEASGACQSLLAESTLASWMNDYSRAKARALAANTLAETAGMLWYQSWAAWQLGCLAVTADDLDAALVYFANAQSAALDDPSLADLPRQAERLALIQRELRRQREFHRQSYFTAEQAEQIAADRLRDLLASPAGSASALLESHSWAQLPLMLKLPAPNLEPVLQALPARARVWDRLLEVVGLRARSAAGTYTAEAPAMIPPHAAAISDEPPLSDTADAIVMTAAPPELRLDLSNALELASEGSAAPSGLPELGIALERGGFPRAAPAQTLASYLLGPFRVTLNDRPIASWPSGRGRAVFKYLLTQRGRPVPRDVLMDLFWPDAGPESARNSLNVALHGLRQALRAGGDLQVVLFENGAYRLNPDLAVWVDVDEFERRFQTARRLEATGQLAAAVAEYEVAVSLYQDDFFVDDPYEEWPVLTRERLRVMFLEALDRLSQIRFGQGQYAACASLCQRVLERDSCREDVHCRLMRCYSRQGQQNLALRQYQVCAEALRAELDVEPAASTDELHERIRRHEAV